GVVGSLARFVLIVSSFIGYSIYL
ncbi:hypothetical protein A2U01_0098435, partial [Trifolium medium]|nr:hypothetical protein [Trifolium medium]